MRAIEIVAPLFLPPVGDSAPRTLGTEVFTFTNSQDEDGMVDGVARNVAAVSG